MIISPLRGNRPLPHVREGRGEETEECPFCPGNEHMTPPEVWADREGTEPDTPGWRVRSFPNMYPALSGGGCDGFRGNEIHRVMRGCGVHEVIVDCPEHYLQPADMSLEQLERMLNAFRERYVDISGRDRIKYVQIFRNHGMQAGRSMTHPHSQLVATPLIPSVVQREICLAGEYFRRTGGCLADEALRRELSEGTRVVTDSDRFTIVCPFAAQNPYEMYIFQKEGSPSFESSSTHLLAELASLLKDILMRIDSHLEDPPYNIYIHSAPCDGEDYPYFRWHIHLVPRLIGLGGFEMGTGISINSMPPERSARALRDELTRSTPGRPSW